MAAAQSHWEGAVKRNVVALVLLSFIVAVVFSAANLLLPYLILAVKGVLRELPEKLASINASRAALEMGSLVTAFMASRALVAAASGWLSDIAGRKPMILAGTALYVASSAGYYWATSLPPMLLLRGLQGVASAMVWPVAEALLMDSVPPLVRTRAMSLYVVSFSVGNVGGPLLGSALYEASRSILGENTSPVHVFQLPFLLLAGIASAGLLAALAIRDPGVRAERHGSGVEGFRGGLLELPRPVKRALQGFYVNALLNGVAMGIVSSIMILYIIQYIVHTPTSVGLLMAVPGIFGLAVSYPAARLMDRLSEEKRLAVLVATMAASRVALATIGFIRSVILFLAVAVMLNIAMNIVLPLMRSLEAGLVPGRLRGRVFGLHQAFFNAGMTVGPLIGSWIYEAYSDKTLILSLKGPQAVFILAGLLGLAGVPVLAALYKPGMVREAWQREVSKTP